MALTAQSKRLSFGSEGLYNPERLQSKDTLAALTEPSYESFVRYEIHRALLLATQAALLDWLIQTQYRRAELCSI